MKAVVEARVPSADLGIKSLKISKGKFDDGAEMTACFHKLKDLVPTVNPGQKLSKKDLLQHVIDYILDLELALEFQPIQFSPIGTTCRTPLSEKPASNSILKENSSYMETDIEMRPPSK
ncbi:hypothetical protein LOTGIDRAFT_233168 [Lottia gigantea]|uniref:BHLH domain-containing protein n=1 Tax=Lottia gigantea TaxID=225164 RepID=V4ABG8_LOTGI|nr:hypothetical protein LOTGIDRAFT_233168 [Lottia gigantea]ESO92415.1 hypothetical protein LOTGIDRAFT_233168 [Lottia gigantea]